MHMLLGPVAVLDHSYLHDLPARIGPLQATLFGEEVQMQLGCIVRWLLKAVELNETMLLIVSRLMCVVDFEVDLEFQISISRCSDLS